MCLILFSLNQHPTYKLIVAANRDEFFNRKTAAADFWEDHQNIIGGRDLEAGGTWMAMTRQGKIALITNYRDPANIHANAPSRGKLVSDYLIQDQKPEDYLHSVEPTAHEYNGFNLLAGTPDELFYFSNYRDGIQRVDAGVHGLSNHLLETPWPKVTRGKAKLQRLLLKETIMPESLFQLLYDDRPATPDQLPNTGIGKERELALSSIFIKTPGYGTRCSTIVLVNQQNEVQYFERVYDLTTYAHSTRSFRF